MSVNETVSFSDFKVAPICEKCFDFNLPVHVPDRSLELDATTVTTRFCASDPSEFAAVKGMVTVPAVVNWPLITAPFNVRPAGTTALYAMGAAPVAAIV